MLRSLVLSAGLMLASLVPGPSLADEADELFDALRVGDLVQIMEREGLDHAAQIEESMFPQRGGAGWRRLAGGIYDAEQNEQLFRERFRTALGDEDLSPMLDFFESARGRNITDLEIEARRAFLNEKTADAAKLRAAEMRATDDPLIPLLERFVAVNDLIEMNVTGGLNGNLAFYHGLQEGGALGKELGESEILNLVWSQEEEIRADTTDWIYGFQALAYAPLSKDDLEAYIAFSETASGQALNRALFAAFDAVFERVSHDLGRGAAIYMKGQDI